MIRDNLRFFMDRSVNCNNPNALSRTSKGRVSPNTVRNLLDRRKRTTTTNKPEGYPTLDKLAAVADTLGREVWELLHPDIERSIKERDVYKIIEQKTKQDIVEEMSLKKIRPQRRPEEQKG